MDRADRVVYIGTFTKVIFPSLRLAYLVAPKALIPALIAARSFVDRHSPTLPQMVLTDFMSGGHFTAHLRRMRALYRQRRRCLLEALERRLGRHLRVCSIPAGMHLTVELPAGVDDLALARRAAELGLEVSPLSRYYLGEGRRPGLLLGYSAVGEDRLREGVERLASLL